MLSPKAGGCRGLDSWDGNIFQKVRPMQTIDFSRSFLLFRVDFLKKPSQTGSHAPPFSLNSARIQIDSRCRVRDLETGRVQTFVMGASCKTERVGVEKDIWTEPNADFVPIFSDERFLNIKTYAKRGVDVDLFPPSKGKQGDRQTGVPAEAFDAFRIDVTEAAASPLESANAIIEATYANRPLVATTVISQGRYEAAIEYPVKTMNVNERDGVYQTDTGPVLFPDLSRSPDELIAGMEMAFAAFNCPQWIEFIVRGPTDVGENISVYHYSRKVRLDGVRNSLCALSAT